MIRAIQAWDFLWSYYNYDMCCGTRPTEDAEGYAHYEGWDSGYPSNDEMDPEVLVEVGLKFRQEGAQCYYLIDTEHSCDTVEFGDAIPYPEVQSFEWANQIEAIMQTAAEVAYNAGLRSCLGCGWHYNIEASPEGCGCSWDHRQP